MRNSWGTVDVFTRYTGRTADGQDSTGYSAFILLDSILKPRREIGISGQQREFEEISGDTDLGKKAK